MGIHSTSIHNLLPPSHYLMPRDECRDAPGIPPAPALASKGAMPLAASGKHSKQITWRCSPEMDLHPVDTHPSPKRKTTKKLRPVETQAHPRKVSRKLFDACVSGSVWSYQCVYSRFSTARNWCRLPCILALACFSCMTHLVRRDGNPSVYGPCRSPSPHVSPPPRRALRRRDVWAGPGPDSPLQ